MTLRLFEKLFFVFKISQRLYTFFFSDKTAESEPSKKMKVQSSKSTEFFLKKIKTPKGKSMIFIQICTKNFPPTPTVLRAGAAGVYFFFFFGNSVISFTCTESYSQRTRVEFARPA